MEALPGDTLGVVASYLGAADALAFAAALASAAGAPPASEAVAARAAAVAAGVSALGAGGDPLAGLVALHAAHALPPGSDSLGDALWELGAGGHLPPAGVGRALTALILDAADVDPAAVLDAYFVRALPVPAAAGGAGAPPPPTPVAALRAVLVGCRLPGSSRATQCFLRRFARRYAGAVLPGALGGGGAAATGALPSSQATTVDGDEGGGGGSGHSNTTAAAATSVAIMHALPLPAAAAALSEEAVYVLAFSLLVLNADMRAPRAASAAAARRGRGDRMSPARYVAAVREIPDVDGLPDAFLAGCYAELAAAGLPVGDGVPTGPVDVEVDEDSDSSGGSGAGVAAAGAGDGALVAAAAAADTVRGALSAAAARLRAWWQQ